MAMHDIPYMATASPAYMQDLVKKIETAMSVEEGLSYIHIYNPCLTGWGIDSDQSIEVARRSVKSNYFPLYEARYRKLKITKKIKDPIPVEDFFSQIKKFRHLNDQEIAELQRLTDERYRFLEAMEQVSQEE
jgi:pyruvate ferredoxin oxidoreductase beta subunit/phenylglyoxylate dehydrogenase beta subunit